MKKYLFPLLFLASTAFGQYAAQYPSTVDVTTTGKFTADTIVADAVSVTRTAHGAMGSTEEFDAATGFHTGTLDANCTITVINWATSGTASTLTLQITQNATGYFNITWPAGVTNAPPIDPVPSHITVITLLTSDGGTSILASSNFTSINASLPVDDTYSGTVVTGLNAGATIAQWEVVYLNSSSKWVLADADGSGTYPAVGIAITAGTNNNPLTVLTNGTVRNDGWTAWTVGGPLYLSKTAGGLTQTAPSLATDKLQQIGVALAAKTIVFTGGDIPSNAVSTVTEGGTGAATLAAHGVLIGNGTSAVAVSGTGSAGEVLTSNGASADPTFQAAGAGSSKMILWIGGLSSVTADGTLYASPVVGAPGPTEADASFVMPYAGTLKNLNVRTSSSGTTGTPVTVITVRKNKVDAALTVTMNQTNETTTTDSTHTVSFSAGDRMTVSILTTGTVAVSNTAAATIEYDAL